MKHTKSLLVLCVLPLLAGCRADLLPVWQSETKTVSASAEAVGTHQVYYSVTVDDASDGNTTRATLDAEGKYVFSSADAIFVRSTGEDAGKVYGVLTLKPEDAGKSSGVTTFDGKLNVVNGFENEDGYADTSLEAVLVGISDAVHITNDDGDQIVGDPVWPQDGGLVPTMAKAVECYSTLTAQSSYGEQAFHFNQGTCFVNFSVTLDDGTPANTSIGAYVWTDADESERVIRSGTVKTEQVGDVVKANFVAAFPGGTTTLNGAVVGLGGRNPISFGGSSPMTLEANRVYNVNRTFTREPATISFDETSVVKSHPDASFQIAVNNTGDGTVTYASEDETVATVAYDEMSYRWMVTVTGAGETNLTATVTDGENSVYSEYTVSCRLTVYDPVPLANVTASHVGWVIGNEGNVYVTSSGADAKSESPVAMIGYVGAPGTADASSDTYRGLAIALSDVATSVKWIDKLSSLCTPNACNNEVTEVFTTLTGIENTACMTGSTHSSSHIHPATEAFSEYMSDFTPDNIGCSPWFLPSTGQWFKVLGACGVATSQWTSIGGYCPDSEGRTTQDDDNHCVDNYTVMQNLMMNAGDEFGERYWTSTELVTGNPNQEKYAFYIRFDSTFGVNILPQWKTQTCNVRPFIAF